MRALQTMGLLAGLAALAATPVRGIDLQSLVNNSPFLPAGAAATAGAGAAAGPLELRGILGEAGHYFFSIYDSATRRSAWVQLDQSGQPYVVKSYDPAHDSVSLNYQGRVVTLLLRQEKIQALALPSPAAPGGPQTVMVAAGQQVTVSGQGAVVEKPMSAEDAQRLKNIAAEINRLREQRLESMRNTPPVSAAAAGGQ